MNADLSAIVTMAVDLLAAKQPIHRVNVDWRGIPYVARFDFPGVVAIFRRDTGSPVFKSLPGHPYLQDSEWDKDDAAAPPGFVRLKSGERRSGTSSSHGEQA